MSLAVKHKIKAQLSSVHKKVSGKDNIGKSLKRFQKTVSTSTLKRPSNFIEKIEIIVPCYNHAQYLGDTYDSIAHQTWADQPVVITFVDDNSTDNTQSIVQDIKKRTSQNKIVQYIRNKQNLRQWASINKTIENSQNELFIILNDDDLLVPDALEKIVNTYQNNQEIFMLGAHSLWFDESLNLPKHNIRNLDDIALTIHTPEMTHRYKQLDDLNMTHSSSSFFKSVWSAVNGYMPKDQRIHSDANEDRDFQMRVNAVAPVGVYYDYPLAYWRTDSSHGKDY